VGIASVSFNAAMTGASSCALRNANTRKPPRIGRDSHQVQEENEQIVCVPQFRGQRFFVDNFEIAFF